MGTDGLTRRDHLVLRRGTEAYLDGEAAPALAAAVRRHLDQCWWCSEEAEWLVLVKAALSRLDRRRPPSSLSLVSNVSRQG